MMKKNKGFTLTEVIIACGILSLFMGAVMTLYSSGSKMSNSTMWLQNKTNTLRTASRLISESIRKGSYPTKIDFPKDIVQSTKDCFKIQFHNGTLLAKSASSGKNFLVVAECKPVKFESGTKKNDGEILFHVFRLAENGDLSYTYYKEKISDVDTGLAKPIPSGKKGQVIVRDVESVTCSKKENRNNSPIEVTINCQMPKNKSTKRSEVAVGAPNVEVVGNL